MCCWNRYHQKKKKKKDPGQVDQLCPFATFGQSRCHLPLADLADVLQSHTNNVPHRAGPNTPGENSLAEQTY